MIREKIRTAENIVGVIKRNGKVIRVIETNPTGKWLKLSNFLRGK